MRFLLLTLLLACQGYAQASCSVDLKPAPGLTQQKWKKAVLLSGNQAAIPLWSGSSKTVNLTLKCTHNETPGLRFQAGESMNRSFNNIDSKYLAALNAPGIDQPIGAFRLNIQAYGKGRSYSLGVAKRSWNNNAWLGPQNSRIPLVLNNASGSEDVALTEQHVYKTPAVANATLTVEAWFDRSMLSQLTGPTQVNGQATVQLTYL
jgi:hypothetical protein